MGFGSLVAFVDLLLHPLVAFVDLFGGFGTLVIVALFFFAAATGQPTFHYPALTAYFLVAAGCSYQMWIAGG